jgi:hypothetical protein
MVAVVTFAGDTHVVPLNNAAGRLEQAAASDLSGASASGPQPAAAKLAPAPSPAPLPQPARAQVSAPVTEPQQKCGMIPMDDGVKLVPCRPAQSALR